MIVLRVLSSWNVKVKVKRTRRDSCCCVVSLYYIYYILFKESME